VRKIPGRLEPVHNSQGRLWVTSDRVEPAAGPASWLRTQSDRSLADNYRSFEATSVRGRGLDRQNDLEQGPVFAVRRRSKSTAMTLDNRAADSQSQSRPVELCRNERLKYAA